MLIDKNLTKVTTLICCTYSIFLPSVLQFQFVNSYLSLFYIGFYLKDMERLKEVREGSNSVPRQIQKIAEKMLHQSYR